MAQNYNAGANRNWRAINNSRQWAGRMSQPILGETLAKQGVVFKVAKDGRKYYIHEGKAIFLKGSKPRQ